MRHVVFTRPDKKELGFLAETHLYTGKEALFAEQVIAAYEHIACEGLSGRLVDLVYIPMRAYGVGLGRSFANGHSSEIIHRLGKTVHHIEEGYQLSLAAKATFASIGVLGTLFSPALLVTGYVDRWTGIDVSAEPEGSGLLYDRQGRNQNMAGNIQGLFDEGVDRLLVVCGDNHVSGLTSLLSPLSLEREESP